MEIEKNLHMGVLLDIYGGLLTKRQFEIMDLYFNEDLSLSEIAKFYGITRQGVHDTIKHSEETLLGYDKTLKLAESNERRRNELYGFKQLALEALDECRKVSFGKNIADKVIALLEDLDEKIKEYENTDY